MEQAALQSSGAAIQALEAALVVVTPAGRGAIRTRPPGPPCAAVVDQPSLTARSFPVCIERGQQVARQSRLGQGWPPDLIAFYQQVGIDLAVHNEDDAWPLPWPATFVIDPQALLRSADVRVDSRTRAEPAETIAVLTHLAATR